MKPELPSVLREYILKEFKVKEPIEEKTNLKEAGLDSLDIVNLLFAIEEKFGVKIPDEDLEEKELLVFGNLLNFLLQKAGQR
jgi:acyl carrier protein